MGRKKLSLWVKMGRVAVKQSGATRKPKKPRGYRIPNSKRH